MKYKVWRWEEAEQDALDFEAPDARAAAKAWVEDQWTPDSPASVELIARDPSGVETYWHITVRVLYTLSIRPFDPAEDEEPT